MPKVVSRDGTRIAYEKQGSGPSLILVLGALNKRGSGKKLGRALSDQFAVINYDRRAEAIAAIRSRTSSRMRLMTWKL